MDNNDINNRIELLEEHIRNQPADVTANSVSENSFYSYRHANRLFSLSKGESINSFLNKIRHQKAAEYLKYSALSMLSIAIEIGYESTASFSKAFKKAYNLSPSAFRKKYKTQDSPTTLDIKDRPYAIQSIDTTNLIVKKIVFDITIPLEDFVATTKNHLTTLNTSNQGFILLWDEDPDACLSPTSRFFLGIDNSQPNLHIDTLPPLDGRYAVFDTSIFNCIDCNEWHKMAFLILELDKISMRDSTYLEYFSIEALDSTDNFFPSQIAIAIE